MHHLFSLIYVAINSGDRKNNCYISKYSTLNSRSENATVYMRPLLTHNPQGERLWGQSNLNRNVFQGQIKSARKDFRASHPLKPFPHPPSTVIHHTLSSLKPGYLSCIRKFCPMAPLSSTIHSRRRSQATCPASGNFVLWPSVWPLSRRRSQATYPASGNFVLWPPSHLPYTLVVEVRLRILHQAILSYGHAPFPSFLLPFPGLRNKTWFNFQ